jgi:ribonuclease J
MVKITFYGGVNEIGGNKILVEDKSNDASVFLDFGMNFNKHGEFFEEFIQPRTSNGIADFLEMGILPKLDGIYRHDLLEFAGMKKHKEPIVDAVILSHAHLDHSAHISFIDETVPVYCSEITYEILNALHATQPRTIGNEIIDFKKRPILNWKEPAISRKFFPMKRIFKINGLEIELVPVDHSVPGACGMVIHGSDETIAYSGDVRMHGTNNLTQEFIEKLKVEKPDRFLCEGTRIDETEKRGEAYVKVNSDKAVSKTKGLVVADYAFRDATRFKTFFQIATDNNRKLCIPFRDAYYIRALSKFVPDLPDIKDENILLYKKKKGTGTFLDKDYEKWENEFLDMENTVKADFINKHQDEVILSIGYFEVPEFIDIRPKPNNSYLIWKD